jgi:hypothetical protein
MGNTVSELGSIKQDTVLGNYIKDWALNDYNPDPNNSNLYKYSLKKRACCTKQREMPISLPDVENNKIILTSVNIPVFKNDAEINSTNCEIIVGTNATDTKDFTYTNSINNVVTTTARGANFFIQIFVKE